MNFTKFVTTPYICNISYITPPVVASVKLTFFCFSSAISPRSQKTLKEGFWSLSFRPTTRLWDSLGETHAHNYQIKVLTFPLPLRLLFRKLANMHAFFNKQHFSSIQPQCYLTFFMNWASSLDLYMCKPRSLQGIFSSWIIFLKFFTFLLYFIKANYMSVVYCIFALLCFTFSCKVLVAIFSLGIYTWYL